jgi:ribosome-associated toxin RatA of RatAB toxin-antitoxin module
MREMKSRACPQASFRALLESPILPIMVVVDRSIVAPYSAEQMFALVEDIESYPSFLPWCAGTEVVLREPDRTIATIHVSFHGLRQEFTTENRKHLHQRIDISLVSGPFRELQGHWVFTPLGESGSKVAFRLQYQFSSRILEKLAGPVFHHIADTFVDAFLRRAERKYGSGPA